MVIETSQPYELLIADDSRSFRETLRELLEPRHLLRVHEVESGEAAIEYTQEFRIDIVLLDMHMHLLTGLETLKELKDLDAVRPCILITSDASDELRRDAEAADAYTVLSKPVRRAELCSTIVDALVDAYRDPTVTDGF
ncbi:MAG: response regulator [Fuerstiella sp.]